MTVMVIQQKQSIKGDNMIDSSVKVTVPTTVDVNVPADQALVDNNVDHVLSTCLSSSVEQQHWKVGEHTSPTTVPWLPRRSSSLRLCAQNRMLISVG